MLYALCLLLQLSKYTVSPSDRHCKGPLNSIPSFFYIAGYTVESTFAESTYALTQLVTNKELGATLRHSAVVVVVVAILGNFILLHLVPRVKEHKPANCSGHELCMSYAQPFTSAFMQAVAGTKQTMDATVPAITQAVQQHRHNSST